jgi:hypothetical protein
MAFTEHHKCNFSSCKNEEEKYLLLLVLKIKNSLSKERKLIYKKTGFITLDFPCCISLQLLSLFQNQALLH